jgi:surface antigen
METIMHSQLDPSDPTNDASDTNDASNTPPRSDPQSWRERHALKVLGAVMAAMFATVIIAQVAC